MLLKNHYFSAVFLLISQLGFTQQTPITFDESSHVFTVFNENTNVNPPNKFDIFNNENDSSDKVGRLFMDGPNPNDSQGFYIDLSSPINLDVNKIITLDFFKYDGDAHTITVKLEQGGLSPDVEVSTNISGAPSSWNNGVQFDFSNATQVSDNSIINAIGNYSRLTLFIDKGVSNKPPGTFHVDDINNGAMAPNPNALDVIYTDLVWSDEFSTAGLNNPVEVTNWHHQTQIIIPGVGWANGEVQHYTNRLDNSFVENGFLNIVAKKEVYSAQGLTKNYTSARLNSKFAFTYGRVDVRAKLPFGEGTFPAIWTLGKNINENGAFWDSAFGSVSWPNCGEIDIMEHGLGALNQTSSALHTPSSFGNTVNFSSQVLDDVANNFHVYSVNWSPNQITFLVDGVGYYTYNPATKNSSTWPFDSDHYLLLNVAMGGIAGPVEAGFTQSSMVVDYVRVYQNNGLSVADNKFDEFELYPNPTSNFLNFNYKGVIDKIEIFNLLGSKMATIKNPLNSIDITNLDSGIYLVNFQIGENRITKKLFKN
jgi:beta-glucanase (GH16 family)